MSEPSPYVNCGSLHELTRPEDWSPDRPVWIQSRGGRLERVTYANHLERVGGAQALVLRSYLPFDDADARAGWDGVSDLFEDDPDPAEKARIAAITAEPPDAVTGEEYDPAELRARAIRRAVPNVWVLEWAAPPGISCPATTAHASEDGAMARIASVAAEHGAEPVEGEPTGGMRMWFSGGLVAMVRQLELLP